MTLASSGADAPLRVRQNDGVAFDRADRAAQHAEFSARCRERRDGRPGWYTKRVNIMLTGRNCGSQRVLQTCAGLCRRRRSRGRPRASAGASVTVAGRRLPWVSRPSAKNQKKAGQDARLFICCETRREPRRRVTPAWMLLACLPFGPVVTSKETFWPSFSVLNPGMLIAEKCANRSSPPPSGVMKPKPLASLNHFTVPVAISKFPQEQK